MEIKVKTILLIVLILLLALFKIACKSDAEDENDLLRKNWIHSYEEDTTDTMIFRPSNYRKFSSSRFRQIFEFKNDDSCQYLVPAADDDHYMESGKWQYDPSEKKLQIESLDNKKVFDYRVIQLKKNILAIVK
ncbi:MAG: hypothetical protein ACYC2P_01260 [Paludibacteraceae bacterium]